MVGLGGLSKLVEPPIFCSNRLPVRQYPPLSTVGPTRFKQGFKVGTGGRAGGRGGRESSESVVICKWLAGVKSRDTNDEPLH